MADWSLTFTALMYKMFFLRARRRHYPRQLYLNYRLQLEKIAELQRLKSCLNVEQFLFVKTFLQSCLLRKRRRSLLWWEHAKNKFSHDQWLKYLRMGKENFLILVERITPSIKIHSIKNVSIEKQIAIALVSMASGKSNAHIGRIFHVSKSDVGIIIEEVCEAIKTVMPQYLKVPGQFDVEKNIEAFEKKWEFPQCAGVLGAIHVPIQSSNLPENASDYLNNNNEHSMLLQGVVDASYKFWDVNIGWPGIVPESKVFTSSMLWLKGQDRNLFPNIYREICDSMIPIYILAGTSYPLSHWVLGPFWGESISAKEKLFNEKFTFAYNAIEIAFKRLKARWNCLSHGSICSIEVLPSVIAACCILHNICEVNNEIVLDDWIIKSENNFKQPIPSPCNTVIGPQAENTRIAITEYFANPPLKL
ncbi:protein ANTAGONIST OF LIKE HETEROCHROMATIN PROTEIN 1 [Trichonephila clavata]|uniref:Protein ANTAGONIST OF LIKE HETEROCHROMATIN PROTEIN 1 n=1 Tax=Trichonephila clavata TaxID=2740835 RepID=A0A8X6G7C3_TRICU|nr:protein ANTAGONIST OF LIKE HETEROCHROMATIN PROTEIN 1 [Trichonephila clavata]